MASIKTTFTLDEETVARLSETAARLRRSKSAVVREAINEFSERSDRLSERERRHLLSTFDDLVPQIPDRPLAAVEAELRDIRNARRGGGRGSPVE